MKSQQRYTFPFTWPWAFLVACLALTSPVRAGEWEMIMDLSSKWKFSIGDDPAWSSPTFPDDDWERIAVPSSWEEEGFHGYNGYAWYRTSFRVPKQHIGTQMYLSLGYIDDADEVYLNGKLLGFSGGFPPHYYTAYNAARRYLIPDELIRDNGENVIAVRVYDSQLNGGIVGGRIGLMTRKTSVQMVRDLQGVWEFAPGDNLNWAVPYEYEPEWHSIMVPDAWDNQGYKDLDGFAWYRKFFFMGPSEYTEPLILVMGRIDDWDEVYVNGRLVGKTGDMNLVGRESPTASVHRKFRAYILPKAVLDESGCNILAVRVFDGDYTGGIYQGPVGIIRKADYSRFMRKWR